MASPSYNIYVIGLYSYFWMIPTAGDKFLRQGIDNIRYFGEPFQNAITWKTGRMPGTYG
jgi:hypothetical protein